MLNLVLDHARAHPFRLLCLGAHCDDIEIGCGGTVMRLIAEVPDIEVRWVVFTGSEDRQAEARASAGAFLDGARNARIELNAFRESFLPQQWGAVKEEMERVKAAFSPSLVLTHTTADSHQDHRLVAELTWNTFRDHLILEYEIPKYEGDLGHPNLFVPLTRSQAERKAGYLCTYFESQRRRPWFGEDTFLGLMRIRGIGCHAPSGLAEAFTARKVVV